MSEMRRPADYRDGYQDNLEPVTSIDLNKVEHFADLLEAYRNSSFGARQLGEAFSIFEEMLKDPDCFVVCTLSGAMTIAKMGLVLSEMIERGYVDCIISTGALQAHGMIEGTGMQHFKYRAKMNDQELYQKGYNRVYDTLELEKNLDALDLLVREVLEKVGDSGPVGSKDICHALGGFLSERFQGKRGILKSAFEHEVPVYIPAFTDSELGLDVAVHNTVRKKNGRAPIVFDPFIDLNHYTDRIRAQKRLGIFTIGGGVPRNWAQQVGPHLEIRQHRLGLEETELRRFQYGIRICPEPAHWGGLSGCTYSESTSWGKFVPAEQGGRFAEVHSDATLVWPLLIRALMERVPKKTKAP